MEKQNLNTVPREIQVSDKVKIVFADHDVPGIEDELMAAIMDAYTERAKRLGII